MQIFDFKDYKEFLHSTIAAEGQAIPGYKSLLAKAMKAPASFLSQVLHGPTHLTPDHAFRLTLFWNLSPDERDYFLDLVNSERSGAPEHREYLQARLDSLRQKNSDLATRFQQPKLDETESQWLYYSSWHFAAIHLLLTIPGMDSLEKLSQRLGLPENGIAEALRQLEQMKLAEKVSARKWRATKNSLHLPKASPISAMNHVLWRHQAITRLQRPGLINQKGPAVVEPLHYTAQHTLSRADAAVLRSILIDAIEKMRQTVAPSPEEELVCVCCDLFPV